MDPNQILGSVPRYGTMDPLQQLLALLHGYAFQAGLGSSTSSTPGSLSGSSIALGGLSGGNTGPGTSGPSTPTGIGDTH